MSNNMKDLSLVKFAEIVASDLPVPGGGSMAAVCGALGGALAQMVANLTIGKKKYLDVEEEMKEIVKKALFLRTQLLDDIQRDSDSYNMVVSAYKLPKGTHGEKLIRDKAIQDSLKMAASVPLEIAETSTKIMSLTEAVIERGNSNAVTDGLVACMMVRTSVLSALYNVKINLDSIIDLDFVNNMRKRVNEIEVYTIEYERKILAKSPF